MRSLFARGLVSLVLAVQSLSVLAYVSGPIQYHSTSATTTGGTVATPGGKLTAGINYFVSSTTNAVKRIELWEGTTMLKSVDLPVTYQQHGPPYNVQHQGAITADLSPGTHVLFARTYELNNLYGDSTAYTIVVTDPTNVAPTISLAASKTNTAQTDTIVLTPTVADTDGVVKRVDYYVHNGQDNYFLASVTAAPFTYSWVTPEPANYSVTARAYDDQGASKLSNAITVKVAANKPPLVSLSGPYTNNASVVVGKSVTLTATAWDEDWMDGITKVEFYAGATLIKTDVEAPFTASHTVVSGWNSLTAKAYDKAGASVTSAIYYLQGGTLVPIAFNSLTVQCSSGCVDPASATLTLDIKPNGTAAQMVEFYDNGRLIGTMTSPTSGSQSSVPYQFSLPISSLVSGPHRFTAKATDYYYAEYTSSPTDLTVNGIATIRLTSPTQNALYVTGETMPLVATVDPKGNSIKQVDFYAASSYLGTVTTAPFTYNWLIPSNGMGNYPVSAKVTTTANAVVSSLPIDVQVLRAPTISVTGTPVKPIEGNPITLGATINANGQEIAQVEYFSGATSLGVSTTYPYSLTWNGAAGGVHSVTAKLTTTRGTVVTSSVANVRVYSPPTITLVTPGNNTTYPIDGNIQFTANVDLKGDTLQAVTYFVDGVNVGNGSWVPPTYALNYALRTSGTHVLKARVTTALGLSAESAPVTVTAFGAPTISLTSPLNGSSATSGVPVALTASVDSQGATISKVEYVVQGVVVSTQTAAPYTASWTPNETGTTSVTRNVYAKVTTTLGAVATSPVAYVTTYPSPTVALTAPANNAAYVVGAPIPMTVNVAANGNTIQKVEYLVDGAVVSTQTSAPYSATLTGVAVGSHNIKARLTSTLGAAVETPSVAVNVLALPPSVSLSASCGSCTPPGSATLTPSLSDDGSIVKVEYYRSGTLVATKTASPWGHVDEGLAVGAYSYTAKAYDNDGATTISSAVVVTINTLPTVSLTSPTHGSSHLYASAIALAATASDTGGSISKVEFFRNGALINTDTASPYSFSDTGLPPGTYSYTAKAYDNQGASTTSSVVSATISANVPPSVSFSSPAEGAHFIAPASPMYLVTASDVEGGITRVEFYNGPTLLKSDTAAPYDHTWTGLSAGSYTLKARVYDQQGAYTDKSITVQVNNPPTISVSAASRVAADTTVPLSVTLNANGNTIQQVEYFNGTTSLGVVTVSPYSLNWANVPVGTHSITAKVTTSIGAVVQSAAVSVRAFSAPTIAVAAPANGAELAVGARLDLSVSADLKGDNLHSVEYFVNGTSIGNGSTIAPAYASSYYPSAAGSYTVTARVRTSAGQTSTSAPVTVTAYAAPAITLISPVNGASVVSGNSVPLTVSLDGKGASISKVEYVVQGAVVSTQTAAPYSASWTPNETGTTSVTRSIYAKVTNQFGVATSSAVANVTAYPRPTIALTAPANNAAYVVGAAIPMTVNVAANGSTIQKVEYVIDGVVASSVTASPYSYSWTNAAVGSHTVLARLTTTQGAVIDTPAVTIQVRALPTISLTSPTAGTGLLILSDVQLGAQIDAFGDTIQYVSYYANGNFLGYGTTTSPHSRTWKPDTNGTISLTAKVQTAAGAAVTSAPVVVTVYPYPNITLTSPTNGTAILAGNQQTLSANITGGDAISKVEYFDGATLIGTATTAPYTVNWTVPSYGSAASTRSITAKVTTQLGGNRVSAPVSLTVFPQPGITLTAPTNGAVYSVSSGGITLRATPDGKGDTIQQVEFLVDGAVVGTVTASPYDFVWAAPTPGTHTLSAKVTTTRGGTATSSTNTIHLNQLPTVQLLKPQGGFLSSLPYTMHFEASASDPDGSIASVELRLIEPHDPTDPEDYPQRMDHDQSIGMATRDPVDGIYKLDAPWTWGKPGAYTIYAVARDNHNAQAKQGSAVVTVASYAAPRTNLNVSPISARAVAGQPTTLTFTGSGGGTSSLATKLELFRVDAGGNPNTPIHTVTGSAYWLMLDYSYQVAPGNYQFKLRATNTAGVSRESTPITVTLTNSPLQGVVNGIRIDADSKPILRGWACEPGVAQPLSVQAYANAPGSLGGTAIGSVVLANEANDTHASEIDAKCGMPGTGRRFSIDLSNTTTFAGAPIYVEAKPATGTGLVLPCADNTCTIPGSLRIGMTTPQQDDVSSPNVFMKFKLSGGSAPYDEVGFYLDDTWIPATPDSEANAYSVLKANVAAGQHRVSAKVRQGKLTLTSLENVFYVEGGGTPTTLSLAAPGGTLVAPANLTLTATTGGDAAAVTKVEFLNAQDQVVATGTQSGNTWTASWNNVAAGAYSVKARALNAQGATLAVSASVSFNVAASQGASEPAEPTIADPATLLPALSELTPSGSLPGSFSVSPKGAATYSIPIAVPKGSGGMQPELAINYDSQGGYGSLGIGWSLSGTSGITRCPRTEMYDGVKGAVEFNANDRYCLDGQRLIAVNGIDGGDGTEYRTATESFSRIVSIGQTGWGPTAFRVWTKSGLIVDYGITNDSRIPLPSAAAANGSGWETYVPGNYVPASEFPRVEPMVIGGEGSDQPSTVTSQATYSLPSLGSTTGWADGNQGEVMVWAQSRVTDVMGNRIDFAYGRDTVHGEYQLERMDYSNGRQSVLLAYKDRTDPFTTYVWGAPVRTTKLLDKISVLSGTDAIQEYKFSYEISTGSNRSLLSSVEQCAVNGSNRSCLPITTFSWEKAASRVPGFESTEWWPGPIKNGKDMRAVDVDGDGRTDLVYRDADAGGALKVCFSRAGEVYGAFNCDEPASRVPLMQTANDPGREIDRIFEGDYDGDGRVDFASYIADFASSEIIPGYFGMWSVCLNKEGGYQCAFQHEVTRCKHSGIEGDFEGCLIWEEPSVETQNYWRGPNPGTTSNIHAKIKTGDFNGDGKTDLIRWQSGQNWLVHLSSGIDFEEQQYWSALGSPSNLSTQDAEQVLIADFDSDGKSDLMIGSNGAHYLCFARDRDFLCQSATTPNIELGKRVIGDYNGDGKPDIAVRVGNNQWGFCLASGQKAPVLGTYALGFDCPKQAMWSIDAEPHKVLVADVNGDGLADLLSPQDNNKWMICASVDGSPKDCYYSVSGQSNKDDPAQNVFGDFNGDGKLDVMTMQVYEGNSGTAYISFGKSGLQDTLVGITNGDGAQTELTYKPLTDASVYTKGVGSTGTTREMQGPLQVVAKVEASDGLGGKAASTYKYEAMRSDTKHGMLGFAAMEVKDERSGVTIRTENLQDVTGSNWPYVGMVSRRQTRNGGGIPVKEESFSYATLAGKASAAYPSYTTVMPYPDTNVVKSFDPDTGELLSTTTTTTVYGAVASGSAACNAIKNCGNPTKLTVTTESPNADERYTTETTNIYEDYNNNGKGEWRLGRLMRASVTHSMLEDSKTDTQTRTSAFTYYPSGLLKQEIVEPDQSRYTTITEYEYDRFGNKVKATVKPHASLTSASPYWFETRATTTKYDATGRYPEKVTNALNQSETRTFTVLGQPESLLGPNGLTTTWTYDGFGRTLREDRADGTATVTRYGLCAGAPSVVACPSGAHHFAASATTGGTASYVFFDSLNREVQRRGIGFNGAKVYVETEYNTLGMVKQSTRPFFEGHTKVYDKIEYDALGRVKRQKRMGNGAEVVDTLDYDGLTTTVTNAEGHTRSETKLRNGKTKTVTDALGQESRYRYDALGNLRKVEHPDNTVLETKYDQMGRKIEQISPDSGTWTYEYDALGQLKKQTDAKQQAVKMYYDLLGRLTRREEVDLKTDWTYDNCTMGVGKLCEVANDNDFGRKISYDNKGRPKTVTPHIDQDYTIQTEYDAAGRTKAVTYPNGVRLRHVFNDYGYLSSVWTSMPGRTGSQKVWEVTDVDAKGRHRAEAYGNGLVTNSVYNDLKDDRLHSLKAGPNGSIVDQTYEYDSIGRLETKLDPLGYGLTTYEHDELNRLRKATWDNQTQEVTYFSNGNIQTKTGVGTYAYNLAGKPHAVSGVTGTLNGVANPTFTYDANGNMQSGAGRTFTWFSFNQPKQITGNGRTVNFLYDEDHLRVKEVDGNTTTYTINPRLDLGHGYQRVVKDGIATEKVYVSVTGKAIAAIETKAGTATIEYMHHDVLGSVVAITNEQAQIVVRFRYDPWGKRLLMEGASGERRGFTGHEELTDLGLVNMNGRIYDPVLGRFISADPFIQDLLDYQNANRYSYVLNDPLRLTDPSGQKFKLSKVIKIVAAIVVTVYAPTIAKAVWGEVIGGYAIVQGATAGFIAGGIQSGTLKGAFVGALSGAAFARIGDATAGLKGFSGGVVKTLAHGMVGGAMSVAAGGDFESGFLSTAFATAAGGALGLDPSNSSVGKSSAIFMRALIGGAAAELAGGKFANGAISAAFAAALNEALDHNGNRLSQYNSNKAAQEQMFADGAKLIMLDPLDPANGDLLEWANNLAVKDANVVVTHGNQDGTFALRARIFEGDQISPGLVAAKLIASPGFNPNLPTYVVACYGGVAAAGYAPAAQGLADSLFGNGKVYGAVASKIYPVMGRFEISSKPNTFRPVNWKEFSRQGGGG
ncbi:Ig-like domain-containing protein [Chitinimonas sp. BJYL2]|uniref:Ig-like domain-containing protein n=1 Tax=Chitinimonas sp. BJYL2 TaxID=2976696 RepID=UPI0022B2B5BA|nr:Ig-like domain-containing protein [Chitinimonas sp. BJYL2]